jgi:hypothetical protein
MKVRAAQRNPISVRRFSAAIPRFANEWLLSFFLLSRFFDPKPVGHF